jgi:uncharacterized membrane protein
MKTGKLWLVFALVTTIFWGVWGAFSALPEKAGFPGTLVYVVWSVTMIIPAIAGLKIVHWKIEFDLKSIIYGLIIGFTGAGGQLALLTRALKEGPAHLIFPIISLSPVITLGLSFMLLKEHTNKYGKYGIILALLSIPLLSITPAGNAAHGHAWLFFSLLVFFAWGVQAYFMKLANKSMKAESIFFYMTITGLILAPIAIMMTDFSKSVYMGFKGPYLAFLIQILNSIGALSIVYAFRYGKAIIVSPLTNTVAPVITIILSLIIYQVIPGPLTTIGILLAVISTLLFSFE